MRKKERKRERTFSWVTYGQAVLRIVRLLSARFDAFTIEQGSEAMLAEQLFWTPTIWERVQSLIHDFVEQEVKEDLWLAVNTDSVSRE